MGSSFIEYNGNGFWSRDSCIEIWLEALVQAIERLPSSFEWLTPIQQHWHLQAVDGISACLFPDLDRFVTTNEQKRVLIALSEQAITALAAYGKEIPCAVLNAMVTDETVNPQRGYFKRDVPTEDFLSMGRAFIQLLKGERTPSPSISSFRPFEVVAIEKLQEERRACGPQSSLSQEGSAAPEQNLPAAREPNETVRRLVLAGELIKAIKVYRDQTGVGWRESKEVVDRLRETLG